MGKCILCYLAAHSLSFIMVCQPLFARAEAMISSVVSLRASHTSWLSHPCLPRMTENGQKTGRRDRYHVIARDYEPAIDSDWAFYEKNIQY